MKFRFVLTGALLVVALGGCASSGDSYRSRDDSYSSRDEYQQDDYSGDRTDQARCVSCGVVESIEVVRYGDGGTTGAGAVAGALVGAAVGSQVGSGSGRDAATVAGAVAGAVAGNQIERDRVRQVFAVTVRMDDGRRVVIEQRALQGMREGARVVVRGDSVQLM